MRRRLFALLALLIIAPVGVYLWHPALVLVAGFELAGMLTRHAGAGGNDCTGQWSPGIDADNPYFIPFFPEAGARYHAMVIDAQHDGSPVSFRVSGQLPKARYASFHVYDADTGHILGALADHEFAPEGGDFAFQIRQDERDPAGLSVKPGARRLGLVWRLYFPQAQATPLPVVTLHDAASGAVLPGCKHRFTLPQTVTDDATSKRRDAAIGRIVALAAEMHSAGAPWPVRFFARHPQSAPFFANRHVVYAFGLLDRSFGDYAHVTFRPPKAAPGLQYWSVCLSGLRETSTSNCLADFAVKTGPDGWVHILIGAQDAASRARAVALGYNHFGWGWFTGARVVVVRQLYRDGGADFDGSFVRLPDFDNSPQADLPTLFADGRICGFAPVGRYCSRADLFGPGACLPAVGK